MPLRSFDEAHRKRMDRLAEQVVAWHNRHPLAKRISIYDVHTIGVVALPFMRGGRASAAAGPAGPADPIEPVLTDEISAETLAAGWNAESTIAANTNAAHLDALADQEELPGTARPSLLDRLRGLLSRGGGRPVPLQAWPAFSERFVGGLSPGRIAAFAKRHGYSSPPGDASWPRRVVPIDDALMAKSAAAGGSWPFELYLMSAAIDAGSSRSRILAGQGRGPVMIGPRCLSPWRLGILALLLLIGAGLATRPWWPRGSGHGNAPAAAAALAEVAAPAASAALPASAAGMTLAEAASAAASAPAQVVALAEAASAPAAPSASAVAAGLPDIRPALELPSRPGTGGPAAPAPAASAAVPAAAASSAIATAAKAETPAPSAPSTAGPVSGHRAIASGLSGKPVVALVGPVSPSKAEAEALLERMRKLIAPTQLDAQALQAQVFQTPEGWRAAVWPFVSREEAQLINATLVARGMRTKAVDF